MATYLQSYSKGYIARDGDKYQYNEGGKVIGSYSSVQELVDANPINGTQSSKTDSKATTTADVASASTTKSSTGKRSTKK